MGYKRKVINVGSGTSVLVEDDFTQQELDIQAAEVARDAAIAAAKIAEDSANALSTARSDAKQRLIDRAVTDIQVAVPNFDMEDLETIKTIYYLTVPAARSNNFSTVVSIYQYVKNKTGEINSMDANTAIAYDPITDPSWPV